MPQNGILKKKNKKPNIQITYRKNCKTEKSIRDRGGALHNDKRANLLRIPNVYAPNGTAEEFVRPNLIELKGKIDPRF